jgi:hypothetical protein
MALLHLSELPPRRTDEAYGLVRLGSDWSQSKWREWLQGSATSPRGVLSASASNGVLLGLAAYEADEHGPLRVALRVPLFVAFELCGKGRTRDLLREGLEQLGERLGCDSVRFG